MQTQLGAQLETQLGAQLGGPQKNTIANSEAPSKAPSDATGISNSISNSEAKPHKWSVTDIIVSFAKENVGLVTAYILLVALATALGVVGSTKVLAALYAAATRGEKNKAFMWLAASMVLAITITATQWSVEYCENLLDVTFTKFALFRAVKYTFDANDIAFLDLGPMQYRAFVRTSADSSREVFKQVVKAYAPNIVLIVVLMAFLFSLEWRYGMIFLACLACVVALFAANHTPTIRACRRSELSMRRADFRTFDVLQAMPTVVSAGQSVAEQKFVQEATTEAMNVRLEVTQSMVNSNTVLAVVLVVATMTIMLMAVWSMKNKDGPGFTAEGATKVVTVLTLMGSLQARFQLINNSSERMSEQMGRFEASSLPQVGRTLSASASTARTELLCGTNCACAPLVDTNKDEQKGEEEANNAENTSNMLRGTNTKLRMRSTSSSTTEFCTCPLAIEFDQVSFAYEVHVADGEAEHAVAPHDVLRTRDVLRNFSWKFGPGGISCLRAPSGTGKTTLAKLLVGMYEPQTGVIRVNGIDLKNVDRADLRCRITFTNQDQPLLNRTIDDNIRYGAPHATEAQVEAVWQRIRGAFAGKTRQTRVGKMGKACSTGMRQLLRLANIELRGAGCVVADEPCSGLDAANKQRVTDSLRALAAKGVTVLIITHDDDTASLASNVKHMVPAE